MKLIRNMFPGFMSHNQVPSPPLGLRHGQLRQFNETLAKNAGWYNAKGERIGLGDLSFDDVRRISEEIDEGEFFVLLSEHDSYKLWLGTSRIADRCEYVIGRGKLVMINSWGDTATTKTQGPLMFDLISQEDAYKLLLTSTSLETEAEREEREMMDDHDALDGNPGSEVDLHNRRLEEVVDYDDYEAAARVGEAPCDDPLPYERDLMFDDDGPDNPHGMTDAEISEEDLKVNFTHAFLALLGATLHEDNVLARMCEDHNGFGDPMIVECGADTMKFTCKNGDIATFTDYGNSCGYELRFAIDHEGAKGVFMADIEFLGFTAEIIFFQYHTEGLRIEL